MNLLIPYIRVLNPNDPLLEEFTYGDDGPRAMKLKNDLKKGDYVFFHTSIRGIKYITAYYVVDRVLDTAAAVKDSNIMAKYKNPHIEEYIHGIRAVNERDVILFGDPITSKFLYRPLPFNKSLAEKLSLKIRFTAGKTETQIIGSSTRAWRQLTEKDVQILLREIGLYEKTGLGIESVFSTDEVSEIIERDIENIIEKKPSLIGKSLELKQRQVDTPAGRIDLLFEDQSENIVIIELKLNKIGREAVSQLRRYMNWVKRESGKKVAGIIICKGVMPAFQDEFKRLKDIKIFCYGWQMKVYQWEGNE